MARTEILVSEQRKYLVKTVAEAKEIVFLWLKAIELEKAVVFGLPEIDDRHHVWRLALLNQKGKEKIGEAVINAYTTEIIYEKTTKPEMLERKLLGKKRRKHKKEKSESRIQYFSLKEYRRVR